MYVRVLNMNADQDLAGTMVFVAQALLCLFHVMEIFLTIDASDELINEVSHNPHPTQLFHQIHLTNWLVNYIGTCPVAFITAPR
jgi:hypothetical protein